MPRRAGYHREQKLLNRYQMSEEQYQERLKEQGGVCWICGKEDKLVVDHCHATSTKEKVVVRGLLCKDCNVGLGYFKDDVTAMRRAIAYLKRSK